MKVKALVAHDNDYGVREGTAKYHKPEGSVYVVPDDDEAERLIAGKYVEKHSSERKG